METYDAVRLRIEQIKRDPAQSKWVDFLKFWVLEVADDDERIHFSCRVIVGSRFRHVEINFFHNARFEKLLKLKAASTRPLDLPTSLDLEQLTCVPIGERVCQNEKAQIYARPSERQHQRFLRGEFSCVAATNSTRNTTKPLPNRLDSLYAF
uniref:Uncharacterized protein n=1 Tax=Pristionchus pacificus TaxID=54126 RepID=A0A8R1YV32_PRIPA